MAIIELHVGGRALAEITFQDADAVEFDMLVEVETADGMVRQEYTRIVVTIDPPQAGPVTARIRKVNTRAL